MPRIFIAYPYEFSDDYRVTAMKACSDLQAEPVFGDANVSSSSLVEKMSSAIEQCDFAFFDITGFNPNVMMELGMAYQQRRKIYFMYDQRKHKNSPAAKSLKDLVPTNIRGQDHFEYQNLAEFSLKFRKALHDGLGVGKNSIYDIKAKIDRTLRTGPKRLGEIAGANPDTDEGSISEALAVMRAEKSIACKGHGMGAKWELLRR